MIKERIPQEHIEQFIKSLAISGHTLKSLSVDSSDFMTIIVVFK